MAIGSAGVVISSSFEDEDSHPRLTDIQEVTGECTTPVKRRKVLEDDDMNWTECTTVPIESTPNEERECE